MFFYCAVCFYCVAVFCLVIIAYSKQPNCSVCMMYVKHKHLKHLKPKHTICSTAKNTTIGCTIFYSIFTYSVPTQENTG